MIWLVLDLRAGITILETDGKYDAYVASLARTVGQSC